MNEWCEVVFEDLLSERLRNGVYKSKEFHGRGVKVVNMKELFAFDRLDDQPELRVELTDSELERFQLNSGDLLFARRSFVLEGSGKCSIVGDPSEPTVFESSMIRARVDPRKADAAFLYYLFRSAYGRARMASIATRTAVSGITGSNLAGLRLDVPAADVQRRIATVLTAFDDLIENNRRRVEALEAMAGAIYREWFVRFRYPGHEDVPLVDSPLGAIPQGWTISTVGDLAVIDKGLSYKGAHLAESGTPMANLKCLRPGGGFRRDGSKPYNGPFKARHQVATGDLVMANTDLTQDGSVIGSPAFVPRRGFEAGGIASHHLFIVRPFDHVARFWLYESFRDDRFRNYARGVASGTTVLGFRPLDLTAFKLPVPTPELARRFDDLASSLALLREDLAELMEGLTFQRDLLLPKLISGQVDVPRLDVDALTEAASA